MKSTAAPLNGGYKPNRKTALTETALTETALTEEMQLHGKNYVII